MNIHDVIELLTEDDFDIACGMIGKCGGKIEEPDLVIAPDGEPYLFRWHLLPYKGPAGCYFHIQVGSDPDRHMHDHPWDNMSVILAGGYREVTMEAVAIRSRGDVIFRRAADAHRLILPADIPYVMTVFTTGPKVRDWGFYYPDGWHDYRRHVAFREDGASIHVEDADAAQPA